MLKLRAFAAIVLCLAAGAQSPKRARSTIELFNQEAAYSDSEEIRKYSRDLISLLIPPGAQAPDVEQLRPLADRLMRAEQSARTGKGKLVAGGNVVRAFNELVAGIGAPSSMRADEGSLSRYREHAASIAAFPALLSANRNGANCNPGEAIFLLHLLISENGVLSQQELDNAQLATRRTVQTTGRSFGVAGMQTFGSDMSSMFATYIASHSREETLQLFNRVVDILGF